MTTETAKNPQLERPLRSRLGWFAILTAVGVTAFLIWFLVNGVSES